MQVNGSGWGTKLVLATLGAIMAIFAIIATILALALVIVLFPFFAAVSFLRRTFGVRANRDGSGAAASCPSSRSSR